MDGLNENISHLKLHWEPRLNCHCLTSLQYRAEWAIILEDNIRIVTQTEVKNLGWASDSGDGGRERNCSDHIIAWTLPVSISPLPSKCLMLISTCLHFAKLSPEAQKDSKGVGAKEKPREGIKEARGLKAAWALFPAPILITFKAGNLSDSFILFVEIESKLIHIHSGFKYQYNFYLGIIKDLLKIKAI